MVRASWIYARQGPGCAMIWLGTGGLVDGWLLVGWPRDLCVGGKRRQTRCRPYLVLSPVRKQASWCDDAL